MKTSYKAFGCLLIIFALCLNKLDQLIVNVLIVAFQDDVFEMSVRFRLCHFETLQQVSEIGDISLVTVARLDDVFCVDGFSPRLFTKL